MSVGNCTASAVICAISRYMETSHLPPVNYKFDINAKGFDTKSIPQVCSHLKKLHQFRYAGFNADILSMLDFYIDNPVSYKNKLRDGKVVIPTALAYFGSRTKGGKLESYQDSTKLRQNKFFYVFYHKDRAHIVYFEKEAYPQWWFYDGLYEGRFNESYTFHSCFPTNMGCDNPIDAMSQYKKRNRLDMELNYGEELYVIPLP